MLRSVLLLTVGAGVIQTAGAGSAQPDAAEHHARPRLIAESSAGQPGRTVFLGVNFEIDAGWHLYWNGRNDSGFPVTIKLALPEGYTADETLWPAPMRNLMPGDLLDHVYEKRVTLLIPLHIPAGAAAGSVAEISAHLEWMECSTRCLLADGEVALSLPIGAGAGASSADAALFGEARARIPVPLPEHPTDVTLSWDGNGLLVAAPDADYLGFYPANDGVALANPAANGESKSGRLNLRFEWPEEATPVKPAAPSRVRGVLEVRRPGASPVFYSVDLAQGQTGGSSQPEQQPAGIR